MVRRPWRQFGEGGDDAGAGDVDPLEDPGEDPLVECAFQDGTLFVYDDHVYIERAGPSKFDDKSIPREEITDVRYSKGLVIGYLQFEQVGVENASGGFLTSPVDENTLHFGRGARDCAERAREEVLFGSS
jgi:hypothetical protein